MKDKIRVGVIGMGLRSQHAYENMLKHVPGVEIVAASSYPHASAALLEGKNEKWLREYSAGLNAEYMGEDHAALLGRDDIDLVSLMCQPDMALELGRDCIKARKAFLRDKPVTKTPEDAYELAALAEKAGVFAALTMPLRYHRPLRQAAKQIHDGQLGNVIAVTMQYIWASGPLDGFTASREYLECYGGGDVTTAGFHAIDYLNWLIGANPISVQAEMGSFFYDDYKAIDMDDLGLLVIEYENGAVANLTTGRVRTRAGNPSYLDVTGEKGAVEVRNFAPSFRLETPGGVGRCAFDHDPLNMLAVEMIDAFRKGQKPPVGMLDGAKSLAVLHAAMKSARSGIREKIEIRMEA